MCNCTPRRPIAHPVPRHGRAPPPARRVVDVQSHTRTFNCTLLEAAAVVAEVARAPIDRAALVDAAWRASWPPPNVETFDPFHLPLMNTLILLLSGTTVTWAHHALQQGDRKGATTGLILTVALGALFTLIQFGLEYPHAGFAFGNDARVHDATVYGASFFMATGFHGAHVIIGTLFLLVCLIRLMSGGFTPTKHFGLEAAAWYWHFVDVVWLFLFIVVYVWGGWGAPIHAG